MSKPKITRNKKIIEAFKAGMTIYKIAKKHKLSWPRTKRIIQEHGDKECKPLTN